ncbi:hypothetical protein CQ13_36760 [Bradyrhizobium retamae]|uniref:Uncharacterized protein n=1 Tax=Bradyrhizobium retamae TaxID=1300035 RepID=A0A0R3MGC3_9BRAD|nr:hypothetical protein CQ13_36760 [Bradyrhizobium retamae]
MKLATRTLVDHIGARFAFAQHRRSSCRMSFFVRFRNCDKERRRTIAIEQPITVLVEHGSIPYRTIDRQSDKLAEQKIVVELLDQLPLRSHRVERFQQQSPQGAAQAGSTNGFPA